MPRNQSLAEIRVQERGLMKNRVPEVGLVQLLALLEAKAFMRTLPTYLSRLQK
ncbi:hypothetical protein DPMN_052305 [Dreissena polymorpha]|uniref:Uncharacterized protein n=1 Tax=Dreissena polymorpha TaxID=45954 RepID=A0A9D4CJG6_DREPO|nr:hypothetical protein DPMN_052305 [Dreissena polymorpha]